MLDQPPADAEPLPVTTLSTPSGMPASSASSREPERGQRRQLGGLEHDGVAAASAGPIFQLAMLSGKFHGTIRPTTPSGSRNVAADAAGGRNRVAVVLVHGARVEVEDLRHHADLAACAGDRLADVLRLDPRQLLVVLLDERRESQQPARSAGATARQAGKASLARATASSVSSTPACGTSAIGSSVAGLRRSTSSALEEALALVAGDRPVEQRLLVRA